MTGIDTNVLARYILQDDPGQAALAERLFSGLDAESPGYIGHIVLVELAWLLRNGYGYARSDVVAVLESLLASDELRFEEPALAWAALHDFASGNADFADCLLAHRHHQAGCSHTVTFDRKASKHTFFRLLE